MVKTAVCRSALEDSVLDTMPDVGLLRRISLNLRGGDCYRVIQLSTLIFAIAIVTLT